MEKLDKKNIQDILALTPLQEGMLFHYLQDPQSGLYFEQLSLEISGTIDSQFFEKAWDTVIENNEMLRTVFRWEKVEKPSQIILKEHKCNVIFYDLSDKDSGQKKAIPAEIKSKDRDEGFDLTRIPFRVILCKLAENEYEMVISNHHILYDGWSNGIILKEFFNGYQALCRGGQSLKPPVKPPFREFLKWIHGQDKNRQEKFWRDYLACFETPTELPIKRKMQKTIGTEDISITLEEDTYDKLNIFVKNNRVTLASVFYSAWGILLQRYCDNEDVIFGTTVSGRTGSGIKGIEDMVGLFINTLPLRIQTTANEKIIDVVLRTDQVLREREEFENTPLTDIRSYSTMDGSGPLFDTIVVIENYPLDNRLVPSGCPLSINSYAMTETTHYNLSVGIVPLDKIEINFSFKQELFDKEFIENLGHHFKNIIQMVIEKPGMVLSQLEIISLEEKNRILYEFNNTAAEYPVDKTIHELFRVQVEKTPDHIALVGADLCVCPSQIVRNVTLTYRQLNEQSNFLAGILIEKGVLPDTIVGIMLERSIEMVIGILGILKSGGAYLPIDPGYPQERIDYMLKDSNARILINKSEARISKSESPRRGHPINNINDQNKNFGIPFVLNLDHLNFEFVSDFGFRISNLDSSNLAYIIYTSGTTGRPKGVLIEHASVVNRLYWVKEQYGLTGKDVVLQFAAFVFDVSVCELFRWIPAGARLCLLPPGGQMDPGIIIQTIGRFAVTNADFIPSVINLILEQVEKHKSYHELASLRWIFTGVEIVTSKLVKRFRETLERFNHTRLINDYGPTESTVDVTHFLCKEEYYDVVPIGKPMSNVQVYIIDKWANLQPTGIAGELCIAGSGLARGYLNNPELTAERFKKNHGFYRSNRTYIFYKTGDLARWLLDGNIEFLGRKDRQVKIRGFRVELEEIETRLLKQAGIREAAVLAREDTYGEKYLCAYVVFVVYVATDNKNTVQYLREQLAKELPDYMIPAFFVPLDQIPKTAAGKVDRKALPAPEPDSGANFTAPRDVIESKLVEIWSAVLNLPPTSKNIGIDDNFFRLGGHSLKATTLAAKIHKEFDVIIPLTEIFKTPSIRDLAKFLKEKSESKERHRTVEPAEEKEYYELSPTQKRLFILNQLVANDTSYNMPLVLPIAVNIEKEKAKTVFQKLIERHESLRTSFITVNETPVQKIHREVKFSIEYYEIKDESEVTPLIAGFTKPFKLDTPPLLRANLVKVNLERQFVFIDTHHIITDGTSLDILEREFAALCAGEALPGLRLQYKDYSEWHRKTCRKEAIKRQEEYWVNEFAGEIPVLELPTDYPRPFEQGIEGNTALFSFNERETSILKAAAQDNDVTLYMALLAVFTILFAKLSGQEDIVIGVPIAARRHTDLQDIIGMFVNTLALRNYPAGEKNLKHYLKEVKQRTLSAYENQEYPFEELVEKLSIKRDTGRNPVFDVMLNLLNQGTLTTAVFTGDNREFKDQPPYPHQKANSRFDMAFSAVEQKERIVFGLEYSSRLFTPATIDRFIIYLKTIVLSLTQDRQLSKLEFIPAQEKETILQMANGIEELNDREETIHLLFEEQVERTPDHIALVGCAGASGGQGAFFEKTAPCTPAKTFVYLTYRQLNEQANRLAHLLRAKGTGPNKVVGLMMERSVEMIIALLSVLKAGGAYLPIDTEYPVDRILLMLADSAATVLLTQGTLLPRFDMTLLKGMKTGWKDDCVMVTAPRGQIKDLNKLPKPDRTLVNYAKYHQSIGIAMAKHTVSIQATRGCPFNCAFCHKIWPKTHITRCAENILEEIQQCYDAGVKRFVFIDDIFNLDKQTGGKVFEGIIKKKLGVQLFFPNGLRGDILDRAFIDQMVEAGTVNIDLALESASPRIQKLIHKNLNLEKFAENIHYIIDKYPHVLLEMELMIGFPTETEKEALQTYEFLKQLKWVHFPNLNILKIYPNTEMYRLARENGIGENAIQRSVNLAYHELPDTLPFSKMFVKEYQTRFMNEYLLSKERLLHLLPYQVKTLTENELVQKYNSYLPVDIKSFPDIIDCAGITGTEMGNIEFLPANDMAAPGFVEKVGRYFPVEKKPDNSLKIMLLDLSLFFSDHVKGSHMLYDMIEEPLGLMYLLTYLNEQFKGSVWGKIAKSRVDFDSYAELKDLLMEFKPHLIGIRTLSYYKEFFHRTVFMIRQWGFDVPVIAGGPYATSDYRFILQDSDVDLVVLGEGELTLAQLVETMMANNYRLPGRETLREIPGLAFSSESRGSREVVLLDNMVERLAPYSTLNPPIVNHPLDLLYLIYTSGSTGMPKGVMVEHRNLVNLFKFQFKYTNMDCSRILQFATISFDASFHEIFSAFLSGGRLFLVDTDTRADIPELLSLIARNLIRTVFMPISFLKVIFKDDEYIKLVPGSLGHIQTAGEQVVIGTHFKDFLKSKKVFLHNHYGPSETHVVTVLTIAPGEDIVEFPTIGKPVMNTGIYIVDKWGNLMPVGVPGELLIGGVQVGRGYLNRPELTRGSFEKPPAGTDPAKLLIISHSPFTTHHLPLYKTGDRARFLPDGNIEFLGRIDHQVKIRGFRVEPGEIEGRLAGYPGIKQAVVLVREEEGRDRYICAYIVSVREIVAAELREYLLKGLPDYMVPSYFVQLEKMPLTVSGKIDRQALPVPGVKAGDNYIAPANEIETKLVQIWAEILDISPAMIGVGDNFFQLGGHSLKAIILAGKIHKVFEVKIALSEIFKHPRIRELAGYLTNADQMEYKRIGVTEKKEYYILSSAQRRLYFLQQVDKEGTAYNIPSMMVLEGNIDSYKVEQAVQQLIHRHESLRTSIMMNGEEPVQRIHEHVELTKVLGGPNRRTLFQKGSWPPEALIKSFIRPFDLSRAPLLRVGFEKVGENKHLLMVDMHHIISDGMSMQVLLQDFSAFYAGKELPAIKHQYKDYAEWQARERFGKKLQDQGEYWKKEFTGETPVLELPTDFVRPAARGFEGNSIETGIDSAICRALNKLALDTGVTLYMVLLTVYTIFLARLSNREDIVVGSPAAGRRHSDLEKIIGMFVNTLAMRNFPAGEKKYLDFLGEVKERTLKAFENQEYQYEDLVETVVVKRDISRNPLFDTVFALQNTGIPKIEIPGLKLFPYEFENKTSKFDLTLIAVEEEDKLHLTFEYSTKLFKRETIKRFIVYFKNIAGCIAANPNREISELEILTAAEKQRILFEFNDTKKDYDKDKTVHGLFEEQVERTPDRIAIFSHGLTRTNTDDNMIISYRQLNELCNCLAFELRRIGTGPGDYVGVVMDRCLEMTPAVMGILKAGGAYAPFETYLPDQRIKKLLASLETKCIITDGPTRSRMEIMAAEMVCLKHVICLDTNGIKELKNNPVENLSPKSGPADIAYVIYTSGSTGTPKGVVETHQPVVNVIQWVNRTFNVGKYDKLLFVASLGFDLSVYDIFGILACGGSIRTALPGDLKDPLRLLEIMVKEGITFWDSAPAALQQLVPFFNEVKEAGKITCLRLVFLSGDWIPVSMPGALKDTFKGVRVIALGGATEATIWSNYYPVGDVDPSWPSIPYGKPIQNAKYYILDKCLRPCPVRTGGDLYIGGECLATEYKNDPVLTAGKFIANPFCPGEKIYKTGDMARWLEDGNMQFLGRLDHQVKIRGFRIELGEIESRLTNHPQVKEALVLAREEEKGDKYLCAYIIAEEEVDTAGLREYLAGELPDYMIPPYFVRIEKIPLTPNGKLDRGALPKPGLKGAGNYTAPRNEIEAKLAVLWAEVLGNGQAPASIGIDDNFFQLGGHSLKATVLVSKIHKVLNVKVPLLEVFINSTIRALAGYIEHTAGEQYIHVEPVEKKQYYPLSPAQRRIYILQQMYPDNTAYNMPGIIALPGEADLERIEFALKKLLDRHESLRTSFHQVNDIPVQVVHDKVELTKVFGPTFFQKGGPPGGGSPLKFIQPFDLSKAPLLRVELVTGSDGRHLLCVDMHHIISDGISCEILVRDFQALYNRQELMPLRLQYRDFAEWQGSEREKERSRSQEGYWLKEFGGEIPVLELPMDYSRPVRQSFAGERLAFETGAEESAALRALIAAENVTLFMFLAAVFNIFLAKLSGQEEIIIGAPVAGRRHEDLQEIIGMFVNTLALRNFPVGERTYREFLQEVKEKLLLAFENQEYPFEELVDKLPLNRDMARNPLFDVMFVLQNINTPVGVNETDAGMSKTVKFDLILTVVESDHGLLLTFQYCSALFKKETVERFIIYFKKVLSAVIDNPVIRLSEIEIVTEEEKNRVLYEFNNTAAEYPVDKTIHQLFRVQVEKTPDHIALVGADLCVCPSHIVRNVTLTYRQLNEQSNFLAGILIGKGVQPDTIVGIMMERSVEMIVGIMGILKAGGAYLPIDPGYPQQRIDYMLKDSAAKILITNNEKKKDNCQCSIVNCQLSMGEPQAPLHHSAFALPRIQHSDHLAYIIYTSGSTGGPKGVLVQHRSVVNLICSQHEYFKIDESDRILQFSTFCFDASVEQIFMALSSGAVLVLIDKNTLLDVDKFEKFVFRQQVTHLHAVPSFLNSIQLRHMGQLKRIVSGGDICPVSLVEKWNINHDFYNKYGPTETTVTSIEILIKDPRALSSRLVIGKPIGNTVVYLLDRFMKPVPLGVIGELYIGGEGVTRGYLNRPELTNEKFGPQITLIMQINEIKKIKINKSFSGGAGGRLFKKAPLLYCTGDLGRFLSDGNIEFLGRIDHQVKIRGFRIELGEIENRLSAYPGIRQAVVLALEDEGGDKYLCAYVVCDGEYEEAGMKQFLLKGLPEYMIPSCFVQLEKLPLTPNGKIDRKALPKPGLKPGENYMAPRDEMETKLVQLWAETLGKTDIGINDNFFRLGGHSLKAIGLVNRIQKHFGVKIAMQMLFQYPTAAELAGVLRNSKSKSSGWEEIEKQPDLPYYEMSYAQKRMWYIIRSNPQNTAYNMPVISTFYETVDERVVRKVLEYLTVRHESLRTYFKELDEEPVQVIETQDTALSKLDFAVLDISLFDQGEKDNQRRGIIKDESDHIFNLEQGPLFRARLVKCAAAEYDLIFNIHHIVSDGWSLTVLKKEFFQVYEAYKKGMTCDWEPLKIRYRDYAAWQNRLLSDQEKMGRAKESWKNYLTDSIPALDLPYDFSPNTLSTGKSSAYCFLIEEDTAERLRNLAAEQKGSLFIVLLSAFNILLSHICYRERVIVGIPAAARQHWGLQNIIGLFVNTLILQGQVNNKETFTEFLARFQAGTLNALEYQDYPMEIIFAELKIKYPEISAFFNMLNIGTSAEEQIEPFESYHIEDIQDTKFPIHCYLREYQNGIQVECHYFRELFKPGTIEKIMGIYKRILENIAISPLNKIKDLAKKKELA